MTDIDHNPLGVEGAPTPPPAPIAPVAHVATRAVRRGGKGVVGVILAILVIGLKFGAAFGIGRWIHHGSGAVVVIGVVLLVVLGWSARFLRF